MTNDRGYIWRWPKAPTSTNHDFTPLYTYIQEIPIKIVLNFLKLGSYKTFSPNGFIDAPYPHVMVNTGIKTSAIVDIATNANNIRAECLEDVPIFEWWDFMDYSHHNGLIT